MQLKRPGPGVLLVATPLLGDPNFSRSVVLLLQHDAEGSLGVVLDRPTTIAVDEYLPDWGPVAAPPAVVFHGGPVDAEVGIGVCLKHGSIEVVQLDTEPLDNASVRIFAGYAGWGPGQLEDELDEDAWFTIDFRPDDLLTDRPEELWTAVLRRQPGHLAFYATYPADPMQN